MIKKASAFLLCFIIFVSSLTCCKQKQSNSNDAETQSQTEEIETEGYVSLLTDRHFEKGCWMRGLKVPIYGDPIETFGTEPDYPMVPFQYKKEAASCPQTI